MAVDTIPFDPHVPADLFTAVVEALEAASGEFEQLTDPAVADMMLPDSVEKTAAERAALVAVMKRISYGSPEKRAKLAAMYSEELAKATPAPINIGPVPVSDEVRTMVAGALELVRRRSCVDGNVRDALTA